MPSFVWAKNSSGLPIPRFVSLKNSETNIRTGPGTRYPIKWVYQKKNVPIEIIEEFDYWRKIRDMDGAVGWVHKVMLVGKRHVIINADKTQIIRIDPELNANPVLKIEPTVIVRAIKCEPKWCRIQVSGRKGWIEKIYLWGVYNEEEFN